MAYAAVSSLKHTMECLIYSSPEIINPLYKQVQSLQAILKRPICSTAMMSSTDERIREAVSKFEDEFESYVSDQVASRSKNCGNGDILSVDLQNLKQQIDFFVETVKKMEEEYVKQLENPSPEEEDDEADFGGEESELVGLSDVYNELRDQLTVIEKFLAFKTVSLVGMAGVGKTTLARKFFKDPLISDYFECRAWVKVGRNCILKRIVEKILIQIDSDIFEIPKLEEKLGNLLKESLKGRRFLIVLDDVWDTNILLEIAKLCHYDRDGSRIMLTSRLENIGGRGPKALHVRLLNREESWDLLHHKVFVEMPCSYQFEKVGRKIAENCEGLPLTIIKIADILSRDGNRNLQFWNEVMLRKDHRVFIDAYEEISEVVFPSYDNLPSNLKAFFLYMGVFPVNHEVSQSKVIDMCIAEGFLEPFGFHELEYYGKVCLNELVSHNLVMLNQQSSISVLDQTRGVKTCKLHPSVWYLCNREAGKNKFFHVLTYLADSEKDSMKNQRRLCIHNSIMFSNKGVYESIVEKCASSARTLLCFGLYSQYQVPICFDLKLLRVLDALTIRMYEFPEEVLELVQLRYLALTCDGELPPSISRLWNLHFLIIKRHLSISLEAPSYMPIEIWDMKGLKHLQIVGCNLPNPNGASLYFLDTLLNVGVDSCKMGILEAIPNLKKLGMQILAPDAAESPTYFNYISHLHKLQTLKCVVMNPEFEFDRSPPLPDFSMLPLSLSKLSLSGFGYPWECMRAISKLPNLRVLKLRCYAFQGPKWEVGENEFLKLQFLTIEDTDLEQWIVGHGSFPWLCCLSLEHCYNLEEIKWEFESGVFRRIEMEDCNPLGVSCLEQIREARLRSRHYVPGIFAHSSWMIENSRHESLDSKKMKSDARMVEEELEIFWNDFEKINGAKKMKTTEVHE